MPHQGAELELKVKTINEIIREIKQEYDLSDTSWRVLRGRDENRHLDTFISNEKSLWHLKTEMRNPYEPMGVGVKLDDVHMDLVRVVMSQGELFPFQELYSQRDINGPPIVALGLGMQSQNSVDKVKCLVSDKQKDVDTMLTSSLEKLLKREGMFKEFA